MEATGGAEREASLARTIADTLVRDYDVADLFEPLTEQLQGALNDRSVIEQAKGLLAERGRLDIGRAFTALRDYRRAARLPLTQTARDLVIGDHDPDDVLAFRWPAGPPA